MVPFFFFLKKTILISKKKKVLFSWKKKKWLPIIILNTFSMIYDSKTVDLEF